MELSPHLFKRIVDREFTEVELRDMLERAVSLRRDIAPRRWIVATQHRRRRWEVIVEPDYEARLLMVITAYPVWEWQK